MTVPTTRRASNAFIGSPIERLEDLRFLTGRGQYTDDLHVTGRAVTAQRCQHVLGDAAAADESNPTHESSTLSRAIAARAMGPTIIAG